MSRITKHKIMILILLLATIPATGPLYAEEWIDTIARPSYSALLGVARSGIVSEIMATEGQVVKKGDLLVSLEDRAEQAMLEEFGDDYRR